MYDFIILSLPRSGSHMLASALDSHPEIQCSGEYGMKEKFPLGRNPKRVKGCIIQGYHILREIAPKWIYAVKVIYLYRPVDEIAKSLHYLSPSGQSYDQHLHPAARTEKLYWEVDKETRNRLNSEQQALIDCLAKCDYPDVLTTSYQSLCKGKDARTLRWEQTHRILDFLKVERMPLKPLTHKPVTEPSDEHRQREG